MIAKPVVIKDRDGSGASFREITVETLVEQAIVWFARSSRRILALIVHLLRLGSPNEV
jgi:hypothetical protein